jgi:predicted nucleic acid-binding Zn ribbon protein
MARPGEISLKVAIDNLLNAYKLKPKLNEAKLTERWESIVGKMVEKHTRNLYIKNNKLFVKLDSSVVRQEMMYARTSILAKVNTELGGRYIDEIIFL